VVKYTVHGTRSGLTGTVLVQLPPGYRSATHVRYPVLEAFHGYPSGPTAWVNEFQIGRVTSRLARAHQLRQPLVVVPQVEIPRGVDTEGVNGPPGQPQVETWLTRDVPNWVGQHFRVIANRDAWATIGYSAGGFNAATATVLHPAQYGAAIVLGGYFRPDFGPFYEPFTPTSPQGRRYDLARVAAHHPPPVSIWLETSHADVLSYHSSAQFLRATRRPTAVHAVILQNAGHRVSVWINLLPESLRWLGQNVQGFHP
jgi:enterochelin esterase-like enzyme